VTAERDGLVHFVQTVHSGEDPRRAERFLAGLALARADALAGYGLSVPRLAEWQRQVLGTDWVQLRTTSAYAKAGRERYGRPADLRLNLDEALRESATPAVPLAARAARVYLDLCFYHPFTDGNARAATLALYFVLAREHVVLDQFGPIVRIVRRADDPAGAVAFARLVYGLAVGTRRRHTRRPFRGQDHVPARVL
jgi:nitroreductase